MKQLAIGLLAIPLKVVAFFKANVLLAPSSTICMNTLALSLAVPLLVFQHIPALHRWAPFTSKSFLAPPHSHFDYTK